MRGRGDARGGEMSTKFAVVKLSHSCGQTLPRLEEQLVRGRIPAA